MRTILISFLLAGRSLSSLIDDLKSLRTREESWIEQETYDLLIAQAWDMIDGVKVELCPSVSRDTTPLLDAFNICFGKSQTIFKGNIEYLFSVSCKLVMSRPSSPALSRSPSPSSSDSPPSRRSSSPLKDKVGNFFSSIRSKRSIQTDGFETFAPVVNKLLHKLIADGFVETFHRGKVEDVCEAPGSIPNSKKPSLKCPVFHDRIEMPEWDAFGFESLDFGDETKEPLITFYKNLVNRDCLVHHGVDQILRDTARIPLAAYLSQVILEENQNKVAPDDIAAAEEESSVGVTPVATLAVSQTREYLKRFEESTTDNSLKKQFDSEIRQLFDTCSEVSAVYSFVYRSTTNSMNQFYDGRPMQGERSTERWRKFSYPERGDRFPFHYYQGISDVCYYVMYFGRKPPSTDSQKGTPAQYPTKRDMFNVIATVVEDIHDLPLGPAETVRDPYHANQLVRLFGFVNSVMDLPLELKKEDEAFNAGYLNNIIIRAFVDPKNEINFATVSDGTPRLKKLWSFVFKHGHYGMMAFIVAVYKMLAKEPGQDSTDVFRRMLYPLSVLSTEEQFQQALDEAQRLIETPTWAGDFTSNTFSQFIDEIEIESILKIRP